MVDSATQRVVRQLLVDNGFTKCVYCDGPFETLDHLEPADLKLFSRVIPSCFKCNNRRGNEPLSLPFLRDHHLGFVLIMLEV